MQETARQEAGASTTLAVVRQFHEAFNRCDIDAVMASMTGDCVFESPYPPPEGMRYAGQAAVRGFFEQLFTAAQHLVFETEELFACGDRGVLRWHYRWIGLEGRPGHVRGVDVFRVRDGKVAEKLSYVKG